MIQRPWNVDPLYQEALLAEYKATQEKINHDDTLTWQRGAILLAGVFTSLAVVATQRISAPYVIGIASWFTGIILAWYFWDKRLQSEVTLKFGRLHDIERMLGLRQHSLIDEVDRSRTRRGPTGRQVGAFLTFWLIIGWWLLVLGRLLFG